MRRKTAKHIHQGATDFLLTGRVYCGECGAPMIGDSGTSKSGDRHYYYTCQSRKARRGCTKKAVPKELLETAVVDYILNHILQEPEISRVADVVMAEHQKALADSPLPSMEAELADVQAQLKSINTAIAHGVWSSSTVDMLKELEARRDFLKEQISACRYSEAQLLDRDRVLFFLRRFSRMENQHDPLRREQILTTFVNAIYVFDSGKVDIVVNHAENGERVPLDTLLQFESECSENFVNGVLMLTYPNTVIYRITLPDRKRA